MNDMKKALSILVALSVLGLGIKNDTVYAQDTSDCRQTVTQIKNDIEKRIGGRIGSLTYEKSEATKSPTLRKDLLRIGLGGERGGRKLSQTEEQKNGYILSSNELMKNYTILLTNKCPDVAQVKFFLTFSDWVHTYSVYNNGSVAKDKCLYRSMSPRENFEALSWGETECF